MPKTHHKDNKMSRIQSNIHHALKASTITPFAYSIMTSCDLGKFSSDEMCTHPICPRNDGHIIHAIRVHSSNAADTKFSLWG